ncbi:cell surface biosynthesis associated protein [Streptomyces lincolnensis]|uniref:Cell surface biosynthesis associated protein n=1 Tax=Streptomyces lincolnensis TaxID=1915 RepID=A0A1B1ME04_STRLN|nr:MraY family glycosyltransferase [Streptomyces lincolnensis]ANS66791.1 cell surface biosynthesis associated protein [Streptomyces lincolnensis]AXG55662.1 cell surface biosynthesis associated protein [Streptomyces lincolnensis]QMV07855.1 undecaprenyl/decaprenyl-phosphate alpha-N-acetylglucosaminyl 1-phosphate transferase [Streptomyces lincolnensis]
MLYGIAAATSALFLAAVLAALLRSPALRLGLVDRRWRRPVPLSGGVAVVLAVGAVAGAGQWTGVALLGDGTGRLLAGAATVAVLGFVADVRRVKTRFLVGGTALAAACVVPYARTGVAAGLLAVGWIVFVTLGFRALDHADGLAGTVGVVTAFGVGICAAAEAMHGLAVLLSVVAAALTGFLTHNRPPARVGLGACGALFTGFVLAAAAVTTRAGQELGSGAGVLFALTVIVAADVLLVVLARRPLLRGGPDHLAHRLRRLGLTARGATVVLGVGALSGVLVAVLVHLGRVAGSGVLWVAAGALIVVLALLRIKPHGPRRSMNTQVRAQLRVRNG